MAVDPVVDLPVAVVVFPVERLSRAGEDRRIVVVCLDSRRIEIPQADQEYSRTCNRAATGSGFEPQSQQIAGNVVSMSASQYVARRFATNVQRANLPAI